MSRFPVLLAAAMVVAACGSQQLTQRERAVESQRVQSQLSTWSRLLANRDRDSLGTMYEHSPELSVAWADGVRTRGWDNESRALDQFVDSLNSFNFVIQDPAVEVLSPNVALTTFRYSVDAIHANTARDVYSGQGTVVWVKDPKTDAWLIHTAELSRAPMGS